MNIFDFLFSCFSYIINILNHDFFGFGFSYLDFILAASLVLIILRFLLQGFNETDRFNFFSLGSAGRDLSREYQMSHKERINQIITVDNDLDNDKTTIIRSTRNYDKKGNLTSVVNDKTKF